MCACKEFVTIIDKKKATLPSPSSTKPFAIGPKSPLISQGSEDDYSEIISMTTLGEGYGNYDQIPATEHAQLKTEVIYDVVANYCPEESSPATQTEETNKDPLGEASSGGSKTGDKLASESGRSKDQLPKMKKLSGEQCMIIVLLSLLPTVHFRYCAREKGGGKSSSGRQEETALHGTIDQAGR